MTLLPGALAGDGLEARRDALRQLNAEHAVANPGAPPLLNGVDFVEIDPADHAHLTVHFLADVPPDPADATLDTYGLAADRRRVRIEGGERVVGIRTVAVARVAPNRLDVHADRPGDFSPYVLRLTAAGLDPALSTVAFSFMAPCPSDVDCRHVPSCHPPLPEEPALDYLAKDYASFRRLVLELVQVRNPNFLEDNPADLAVAVAEILAYTGDHLSYFQDAVAGEAYFSTMRRRVSCRRAARLVDFRMHDGRNAWGHVHVEVAVDGVLPAHTPVTTRLPAAIGEPLPPVMVPPADVDYDAATVTFGELGARRLADVVVFETTRELPCFVAANRMHMHTFGRDTAGLAQGARSASLFSVDATGTASLPPVAVGDFLMLEEVRGRVDAGLPVDADPRHRVVVTVTSVTDTVDAVYSDLLVADGFGEWALDVDPAAARLPLRVVEWAPPLPFSLCLATTNASGEVLRNVTVARGNVVLVDQGMRVGEHVEPLAGRSPVEVPLRFAPLTVGAGGPSRMIERHSVDLPPRACLPDIEVSAGTATDPDDNPTWTPVEDLLDSTPFHHHFVAEVDDGGSATLRFGDGVYGADPAGTSFYARYRIGNGPAGNVSGEALRHLVVAPAAGLQVLDVRNPLPLIGGVRPETIDEVRIAAPAAFRVDQERAVTAADYAAVAMRVPSVQGAAAALRWTGSWWTVVVAIDPVSSTDLLVSPSGRVELHPARRAEVTTALEAVRQAGHDLEVRAPRFVSLDIEIHVCARRGHFRADVSEAVRRHLSRHRMAGGSVGFFHPSRWTFGQRLWVSALYAAVEAVEGVESSTVTRLARQHVRGSNALEVGSVTVADDEVVRCDDDPSFPEHGVLTIRVDGGKG